MGPVPGTGYIPLTSASAHSYGCVRCSTSPPPGCGKVRNDLRPRTTKSGRLRSRVWRQVFVATTDYDDNAAQRSARCLAARRPRPALPRSGVEAVGESARARQERA